MFMTKMVFVAEPKTPTTNKETGCAFPSLIYLAICKRNKERPQLKSAELAQLKEPSNYRDRYRSRE